MSSDAELAGPNTKYVQLKVPVPRDPGAYSRSRHFRDREHYRKDPALKPWIIEECIEEGHVKGVSTIDHPVPDVDDSEIGRFQFRREIWSEGQHVWRVIVALYPRAFLTPNATHRIITAYCRCHSDDPQEVCPRA